MKENKSGRWIVCVAECAENAGPLRRKEVADRRGLSPIANQNQPIPHYSSQ